MATKSRYVTENPSAVPSGTPQKGGVPACGEVPFSGGAESLGTNAKSDSALRAERFAMQAASRVLLPKERVSKCLWTRAAGQSVSVWKSVEHNKAHFKGLQTCGSVWHCPVCAAKISERRRAELVSAIAVHEAQGGSVLFLTLTNRHSRADTLQELLDGQQKALKRFWNDRASRRIWEDMALRGSVRATEVTHGENGWHPHYHILLFVPGKLESWQRDIVRDLLAKRWQDCCWAAGLPVPDLGHGCTLQDGRKAAGYAAKWGIPEEMTRGHTKKARGGRSPWQILREVLDTGCAESADLFREYGKAFKGKRQLFWSHGLKLSLGISDLADEELAQVVEDESVHLLNLTLEQWRAIRSAGKRAEVLEAAEKGPEVLRALVESLTGEDSGSRHPVKIDPSGLPVGRT